MPDKDELESLIVFMAIQWMRVPAFRPIALRAARGLLRSKVSAALSAPDSWNQFLRDANIPIDSPGSDYHRMCAFIESNRYNFSAPNDWYVMRGFKTLPAIVDSLSRRNWGITLMKTGVSSVRITL
jgi:hypothetical protein